VVVDEFRDRTFAPGICHPKKLLWRISAPLVEVMVHTYTVRVWIIRLMITVWGSGLKVRLLL